MKNIILAFIFITIVACQNKTSNNTADANADSTIVTGTDSNDNTVYKDSLKYQIVRFYKETKKSSSTNDSNNYGYVKAVYPKFADDQKFLNNKVLNTITAEPWTGSRTYSIEKAAEKFLNEYLQFKKDYPESPAGYSWEQNLKVSFQDVDLVVLTSDSYIYTGGAHGMSSVTYQNLNLKSQKEITLKDLLIKDYNTKLTAVAESIFRKNEGLTESEPLDSYFFENKTFNINDNFAITPKGLLFTYNPYEIKPYAAGITDLLVPYSRLKELTKPNSFISKYVNK